MPPRNYRTSVGQIAIKFTDGSAEFKKEDTDAGT
jgi:hypothetical protein